MFVNNLLVRQIWSETYIKGVEGAGKGVWLYLLHKYNH